AIAATHHEVTHFLGRVLAEYALQAIVRPDLFVRHGDRGGMTTRRGQMSRAAVAGIDSAVLSDQLARTVAIVGLVSLDQGVQYLMVAFEVLALMKDIAIPFQAIGLERAEDVIGCAW